MERRRTGRTGRHALWLACAALAAFTVLRTASGQGLSPAVGLSASNKAGSPLLATYRKSLDRARALVKTYKALDARARAACSSSKTRAALCAGLQTDDTDVVALATNPQIWSWHTGAVGTLANPFGPIGQQGDCWTCVAFSITAAAEAAVARALGLPGGTVSISEQDLGFCPEQDGDLKFCQSSWDMLGALNKLQTRQANLVTKSCLPYTVATSDDPGSKCRYKCNTVDPNAAKGNFKPRQIRSMAAAQKQIRMHGGVITRINIYKDFRPFFEKNPTGIYEGEMCSIGSPDDLDQEHAVVLVGYDNVNQFWIARNSWGPAFGDKGYFRIRYGVCGVASPGEAYGVVFDSNEPQKFRFTLSPDPDGRPYCYVYRARTGDSLGMLADAWAVSVDDLVRNNTATIDDLDEPLDNKFINVCGAQNINVLGAPQNPTPVRQQPQQPAAAKTPQPGSKPPVQTRPPQMAQQQPRPPPAAAAPVGGATRIQPPPVVLQPAGNGPVQAPAAAGNGVGGFVSGITNMWTSGANLMTGGLLRPGTTSTTAATPANAFSFPSLMGRKLLAVQL